MIYKVRFTAVRFMDAATVDDARDAMADLLRNDLDERDITAEACERDDAVGYDVYFVGANNAITNSEY